MNVTLSCEHEGCTKKLTFPAPKAVELRALIESFARAELWHQTKEDKLYCPEHVPAIVVPPLTPVQIVKFLVQDWTEYEAGWGPRPDGTTLHESMVTRNAFVEAFNKKHNNEAKAPHEYTTASSRPYWIDVPAGGVVHTKFLELQAQGNVMWVKGVHRDEGTGEWKVTLR